MIVTSRAAAAHLGRAGVCRCRRWRCPIRRRRRRETVSQYEAVRLFIERARAVKPDFAVTDENAPAVAEICARLDGLPLAIELAAARVRLLPPAGAAARASQSRLALLASRARAISPTRQQTLRGAIAWSYDLLDAAERRCSRGWRCSSGGCTLEAAEAVCGGRRPGRRRAGRAGVAGRQEPAPAGRARRRAALR